MENLNFSNDLVEWTFNNEKIRVPSEHAIIASIDNLNNYVVIETGEQFITNRIYFYSFSGEQLLFCDKQNGLINWNVDSKQHNVEIPNILNIGFFLKKKVIIVMYLANEKEAIIFDLDGNFLCEVEKVSNYEMIYFQEYPDYISIVMEGNSDTEDKFKRSSKNFKLDVLTGELEEAGLSY
ncbi:hypothetical protein JZO81_22275 [Enterococcus hulanensis]|uniref:hypothetical protein n=1 Tax=Enterococcus hulanensis TaxID=2559929 RepID=UPI001A925A3F|nr:hypothetical protein [Enterococcus hulanensis]MBO0413771.1 hypothetical protein [Enterococcus hulanensis]